MHKLRLLRIFLLSMFDTRPTDMVHPVTCRFMVSPFDVELMHASSYAYMAFAGLRRPGPVVVEFREHRPAEDVARALDAIHP